MAQNLFPENYLKNFGLVSKLCLFKARGLRCVFSSDPAVSFSNFVGAEIEENLIRNDPDKSEFKVAECSFGKAGLDDPSVQHHCWNDGEEPWCSG